MNKQLKNKIVYGWYHKGEIFYVGIGSKHRSQSRYARNQYCSNKRAKAERENCFEIRILHVNLSWDQACEKEIELIKQFGRKDLGTGCLTNLTNGGEGNDYWKGKTFSNEHKEKIRESKKGRKQSPETKEKIRQSAKGNTNGKGRKGSTHSERTKRKIMLSNRGENSHWYGLSSDKQPRSKPVKTVLGVFNSLADAAQAHEISHTTIYKRLNDDRYPEYQYQ